MVHIINLTAGHLFSEELMSHPQYKPLSDLINKIYCQLCSYQKHKVSDLRVRQQSLTPWTVYFRIFDHFDDVLFIIVSHISIYCKRNRSNFSISSIVSFNVYLQIDFGKAFITLILHVWYCMFMKKTIQLFNLCLW